MVSCEYSIMTQWSLLAELDPILEVFFVFAGLQMGNMLSVEEKMTL
jgi:hypothetical protein